MKIIYKYLKYSETWENCTNIPNVGDYVLLKDVNKTPGFSCLQPDRIVVEKVTWTDSDEVTIKLTTDDMYARIKKD